MIKRPKTRLHFHDPNTSGFQDIWILTEQLETTRSKDKIGSHWMSFVGIVNVKTCRRHPNFQILQILVSHVSQFLVTPSYLCPEIAYISNFCH